MSSPHWKRSIGNGNYGAPTPVNTLNGPRNPASSSSRLVHRQPQSSPPPSKRQKLHEAQHSHTHTHTQAHFAPLPDSDPPSSHVPRKRSASDSICSISDSHGTTPGPSSNNRDNSQNVPELRQVDKLTKPTSARPRYKKAKSNAEERPMRKHIRFNDDDGDPLAEDNEVALVAYPQAHEIAQSARQPLRKPNDRNEVSLAALSERYRQPHTASGTRRQGTIVDGVNRKRPRPDHDLDELSQDQDDMAANIPGSRAPPKSSSLSTDGDVKRTRFKGTGMKASQQKPETHPLETTLDRAKEIVGQGLKVKRAVDGIHRYSKETDGPRECLLSVRDTSAVLSPTDGQGQILEGYDYMMVNLEKVHVITVPEERKDCCIIDISRAAEPSVSASAKLYVELSSPQGVERFCEWVAMLRENIRPINIVTKPVAVLEKQLGHRFGQATRSTVLKDGSLPSDVKLMQHTAQGRINTSKSLLSVVDGTQPPPKRLKDRMQPGEPTTTKSDTYEVPDSPKWSRENRPTRATRSTVVLRDPTPEPELPSWTANNPGWEQRWRNSLIFPPHGKSRATVDKDDIERLDEGQFLNDNIIIFYLRYLQYALETERPDQAQRIYFQNTFFFDKLKPTKAGGGINYDSVRTWTSKVDLFQKDYIVVPINEHSHWYVAIICNAPKLMAVEDDPLETPSENPPENSPERDKSAQNSITIEDDDSTSRVDTKPELSGQESSHADTPAEVAAGISRMSLHSPDVVELETKKIGDITRDATPTNAGESTKSATINITEELKDPAQPAEQKQPLESPSRKRAGKRQSGGFRRYDPAQPRIITLDSLGGSHSPACNFLKQYLVAELMDKKGKDIPVLGALGMTAKNIPLQSNYCDCGLYLVGYIQEFLRDPDTFIRSVLQHEKISWNLDPSVLRNEIRELIFKLQQEQKEREDVLMKQKRLMKKATSRPSSRDESKGSEAPHRSPQKPPHSAEPNIALKATAEKPGHDTKPKIEEVTSKRTVDISGMFHARDNRDKRRDETNPTEDSSRPLVNDPDESSVVIQHVVPKITTKVAERQTPPPSETENTHVPGQYPLSPPTTKTGTVVVVAPEKIQQSSSADSTTNAAKSPIQGRPASTPPPRTPRKSEDHDKRGSRSSPVEAAAEDGIVGGSPTVTQDTQELANIAPSESPAKQGRKPRLTLDRSPDPNIVPSPGDEPRRPSYQPRQKESTISRHFAGRRDGDTKGHVKCTPKPVQKEYVEISD